MRPRALLVSPARTRGSGAPTGARVLARHPSRASDAGPQALDAMRLASPRGSAHAVRASGGRSPLGAPPRRFFGPGQRKMSPGASRVLLTRQRAGRRSACSCRRDEHASGRDDKEDSARSPVVKRKRRCEQNGCGQLVDGRNTCSAVVARNQIDDVGSDVHSGFLLLHQLKNILGDCTRCIRNRFQPGCGINTTQLLRCPCRIPPGQPTKHWAYGGEYRCHFDHWS